MDDKKLLSDSPWSKKVTASIPGAGNRGAGGGGMDAGGEGVGAGGGRGMGGAGGAGGGGMGPGIGGGTGMDAGSGVSGGGRGGGRGGRGGAGGGMTPSAASITATVRWLTAMPIQQALARQRGGEARELPHGIYAIGIFGLPASFARAANDKVKAALKDSTKLTPKGRDPIHPDQVDFGMSENLAAAVFAFPAKDPITADDKEVEFEAKLGRLDFKCKFKPKDMMFNGKLAV